MKWLLVVFALSVLVLNVPAASADGTVSRDAASIEKGRAIAHSQCARCHGVGPADESPMEQAPPFRRFAERYPVEHLAEALAEGIAVGHNEMPPFEFQPPQIDALLAYLGSLERAREEHRTSRDR